MNSIYRFLFAPALCLFLFSVGCFAQTPQDDKQSSSASSPRWYNPTRYNPAKLLHRGPTATEQLASNDELEHRLTSQLQAHGVLTKNANLQAICSNFKTLSSCISTVRASHSLKIDFSCLKWDVTGIKPSSVPDSCAGPSDGKAMSLQKAIELLKPGADAKVEATNALNTAENDIKDANS
jgi:hypothetical protein